MTEGTFYWSCGEANTVCWFKGKRSSRAQGKHLSCLFCFVFFFLLCDHEDLNWCTFVTVEKMYIYVHMPSVSFLAEASLSVRFVTAFLGFVVMRREKKSNKKKTKTKNTCILKMLDQNQLSWCCCSTLTPF